MRTGGAQRHSNSEIPLLTFNGVGNGPVQSDQGQRQTSALSAVKNMAAIRMGNRTPAAASLRGRTSRAAVSSILASARRKGSTHCSGRPATFTSS
jgi:hypothetical protein